MDKDNEGTALPPGSFPTPVPAIARPVTAQALRQVLPAKPVLPADVAVGDAPPASARTVPLVAVANSTHSTELDATQPARQRASARPVPISGVLAARPVANSQPVINAEPPASLAPASAGEAIIASPILDVQGLDEPVLPDRESQVVPDRNSATPIGAFPAIDRLSLPAEAEAVPLPTPWLRSALNETALNESPLEVRDSAWGEDDVTPGRPVHYDPLTADLSESGAGQYWHELANAPAPAEPEPANLPQVRRSPSDESELDILVEMPPSMPDLAEDLDEEDFKLTDEPPHVAVGLREVEPTDTGVPTALAETENTAAAESPNPALKGLPPLPPPRRKRRSVPPPPSAVAEALSAPPTATPPKRRAWWEDIFDDDFSKGVPEYPERLVDADAGFIERSLGLQPGARVLDIACGRGEHAVELSARDYVVVGIDLSSSQLALAQEQSLLRGKDVRFIQQDMRSMTFDEEFDAAYCWNTSFGYFEEEKNVQVIRDVFRALRPGGVFLLDVVNRDYVVVDEPCQNWFEGDGCTCMDDMNVDYITSRLRVKRTMILDDGRSQETAYSIRVYSLHELGRLLHEVGFRVRQASGDPRLPGVFLGTSSPRVIILASKP